MMKKKKHKGEIGYLIYQRNVVVIQTIILYAAALLVFFTGYFWTDTKANIFSIIAVLMLLPASRSTVSMIMYMKVPSYNKEITNQLAQKEGTVQLLHQMYLTSYQKNYPITCFAVHGNHLIGYTEFAKCDVNECEKHIEGILKQNAVKNVTIKIFRELNKFEERVSQLEKMESHKQDADIVLLLKDISL